MESKQEIRKKIKDKIDNISIVEKFSEATVLSAMFNAEPEYKKMKSLSIYLSMNDEIDTSIIITDSLLREKKVYIQYICEEEMKMIRIYDRYDYEKINKNKNKSKSVFYKDYIVDREVSDDFDIIIVPGRAFTIDGQRLGRGGGHYDKYLDKIKNKNCKKIGFAFGCQIVDDLPTEEHDVAMDEVYYI
jgi:5-formyltetrahydrofolate cyclo-ligase